MTKKISVYKSVDRLIVIFIVTLTFTVFILKFILGSEKIYALAGVYPYRMLEYISILSIGIILLRKSLRNSLSKLIRLDNSILQNQVRLSEYNFLLNSLNLVVLGIFCKVYFHTNSALYFIGTDGDYQLSLNAMHKKWSDSPFYFSSNFLQGLGGNLPFPFNHSSDLGYFIGNLTDEYNKPNALTIWVLLLSVSLGVLARSMKLSQRVCLAAPWVGPMIILFPSSFVMTQIPLLTPHMLSTISVHNLIISIILFSTSKLSTNVLRSILLAILMCYYLISNPTFILLSIPILAIIVLFKLYFIGSGQRFGEFLVFFIPTLIVGLIGGFKYIIGIFLYTSVLFFPEEYGVTQKPITATSILYSARPLVSLLFLISLFTAVWVFRLKPQSVSQKVISGAVITFSLGVSTVGLIYFFKPEFWLGPSPFYFEFMVWSLYSVLITIFLTYFYERLILILRNQLGASIQLRTRILPLLTISIFVAIYFILPGLSGEANGRNWNFPPNKSQGSMLKYLEKFNYQNDKNFTGRFITVTSFGDARAKRWEDLDVVGKTFFRAFDTDFRQGGLWINNLPTLFEVNQLITPRSHFALTRALARESDIQTRDFLITRVLNVDYLRQIGIRYILSDEPLKVGTLKYQQDKAGLSIYLYDLGVVNLGDWYITNVKSISSIDGASSFFSSLPNMKSTSGFVETPEVFSGLVKPTFSKLTVIKGKYHLTASSPSKSLLALPIEYSSCFEFKEEKGSKILQVLPINILQMGIEFERHLDVEISYKFGMFTNPACRLNDFLDFRKLF